ncbi:tetratricopeptide repeat protein [Ulvibacter antarcticus]|nr:tetratricopeptide repeat protein [Ulvibacter antarcticus]
MEKLMMLKTAVLFFVFGIISVGINAQDADEKRSEARQAQELLSDASLALQKDKFATAEADYRRAISLHPSEETGKYNLGTAYYGKSKNEEAMSRFKQAASVATEKKVKHKAFHNLGNTYMNEKKYTEAVEAYKNALRNNPTDDETRYNLALAKELLEKNPPKDDKGDDQNKDQNKEDNKDQQDKKDQGDNKEGDDGDQKEDKDKGDQKDDKKEGDDEKDKGKPEEPKEGEGDKPQQQQQQPGKLSPQQVKSLLEAMNNEEEKVQDKINAQKQKGAKVNPNKDW